jgi:hypothetical protein
MPLIEVGAQAHQAQHGSLYYMRQITILTPFCSIKLQLECGEKLSSSGYIANKMVIMMLLGV